MTDNPFSRILNAAITIIALLMVLYHLLSTQYLFFSYDVHKNLHLAFALVLVFLAGIKSVPGTQRRIPLLMFTALSLALTGYVFIFYDDLVMRIGIPTTADMIVALLLIVVVLEATRRSFGIMLPIFSLVFLAYAFFGYHIPGALNLPLFNAEHIISKIALDFRGIYGSILGISANYIFLFVIFGSFMKCTGTVKFFEQTGRMTGKKFRGGPALSAISTSALFGMFTGAASSNVVLTGSFTIPAMKKAGYTAEEAGAIEAAASTVGQVMPPVMGAAAFVMADFTDTPYIQIIRFAAIPAILTYFSMAVYVQLRAMKNRMIPSDEPVDYKQMLRLSHLFFIPLIILTILLLKGFSPNYAVFWAIAALAGLSPILKETRTPLRYWVDAFVEGAIVGSRIAVMCGAIGIVVATIIMSGLGIKMPGVIEAISGNNMIVALFLTMLASMILGLGMPTTAAYTLVAFTVAPFLVKAGLGVIPAHFFVFYFAVFSLVTPPVAPAVVTASALAGGRFFKSGIEASKIAVGGFLLPFLMIYCPVLLLQPESLLKGVFDFIVVVIILFGVQVVFIGHFLVDCNWSERLSMAISIGCLVAYAGSGNTLYLAGLAGFLGLTAIQFYKHARAPVP
ncbi:MAG: TRAP transporter fused permease subunit [Desulfobacterales bacterium]|nr:TRAP transporter fused permease subunit [Desulfobacterales bacterium]